MALKKTKRPPQWAENGARVRAKREAMGLDRTTCARAAGIDPNLWSQMERGATKVSAYERRLGIAKALGMTIEGFTRLWDGPKNRSVKEMHAQKTAARGAESPC